MTVTSNDQAAYRRNNPNVLLKHSPRCPVSSRLSGNSSANLMCPLHPLETDGSSGTDVIGGAAVPNVSVGLDANRMDMRLDGSEGTDEFEYETRLTGRRCARLCRRCRSRCLVVREGCGQTTAARMDAMTPECVKRPGWRYCWSREGQSSQHQYKVRSSQ